MADLLRNSFLAPLRERNLGHRKSLTQGTKFRTRCQDQSDDLAFGLFSEEDEPLVLSEELLSDEPDGAVSIEEPLAPLLAVSPLGLLLDFSLDGSPDLPLPERA